MRLLALLPGVLMLTYTVSHTQTTITQWTFENTFTAATPEPTTGTGSASIVGSMSGGATGNAGFGNCNASSNTAGIGWQIGTASPGTTNESSGVQFLVSTAGFQGIKLSFDHRLSNSATRTRRIQYTLNGTTWNNLDLVEGTNYTRGCPNQGGVDLGRIDASNPVGNNAGDRWTQVTVDFSAITGANNNPNFGVRIVAAHYSNTGQFRQANNVNSVATGGTWRFDNVTVTGTGAPQMRITEWMYSGTDGEYVEFTNVGPTAIDMTSWSFDDDSRTAGTVSLSAFGTVQPGESVILTEAAAATFRTAWDLCNDVKVIGGNTTNLGRADEINLYDASNNLIDRLTYNDQGSAPVNGPRTQNASAWVQAAALGLNLANQWTLSTVGDTEDSYASTGNDVGSPGKSTRATVAFNPCPPPQTLFPGDVIFNEYASDNDADGNDFFELLVLKDNADLRGLRVSDNELVSGVLNNNESVFIFGNNAYLNNVPKGTIIAVWTTTDGVTTDITTNPATADWKMVLAPGTGVTASVDGLGGTLNTGLSTGGEALYLYLPGPNGNSSGSDNIYLDFVSFESDGGDAPAGLTDLNLTSVADNAFYTGNTAAGNDVAANWTKYDDIPNANATPGEPNPGQDLSGIRMGPAPTISENTASPFVNLPATSTGSVSGVLSDPTDPAQTLGIDFTIDDLDTPLGNLTVTASSNNQSVVPNANLNLTGAGAARNLKITPAGVGYATITVTVSDGMGSSTYTIFYAASAASVNTSTTRFHTGASDASTALAIDADYMLVADDEDQVIRIYDRNNSGLPVAQFDFTSSLNLSGSSEVDIEASTRVGNRIYWMGSHGNNSSGNDRPNRERIFSTDLSGTGAGASLSFVGYYPFLEDDLRLWDIDNGHGLGANYLGLAASSADGVLPEQNTGFNIEGLTFAPGSNTTAYVAFRAPLEPTTNRTKALIVPVTNFTTIVNNSAGTGSATFGAPILLDLGGRGIRSIERNSTGEYLIIAGPTGAGNDFKLFTWTGNAADQPEERLADLTALQANGSFESIVTVPDNLDENSTIEVLVDNGDAIWYNDGIISKDLTDINFQKFRSEQILLGAGTFYSLSGIIEWSRNNTQGVNNATVNLTGSNNGSDMTNTNGEFVLDNLSGLGSYTLTPVKNINKLDGVTTGDVMAIQRHVAGIAPFTSPFDLVAADVNGNNLVSTQDAGIITQALLGNPTALALFAKSWRFVPQSYSLPTPPWGFPETIQVNNVNSDQTGLDFYGIKIGDVASIFTDPANFGGQPVFTLRTPDQVLEAGAVIAVPFMADQTKNLAAWQFALRFDPEALALRNVRTGDVLPVSDDMFALHPEKAGELRAVWAQLEGYDVPEAAPVFTLTFEVLEGGKRLSEVLGLDIHNDLQALAYSAQMAESTLDLVFSQSSVSAPTGVPTEQNFYLAQNVPNPFGDKTQIAFELPADSEATLRVYDVAGRVIWETSGLFRQYKNTVELDLTGVGTRGLLYCELVTPFGTRVRKMMR